VTRDECESIARNLITAPDPPNLQCFALKIKLGRIRASAKFDTSPVSVNAHAKDLMQFFEANALIAAADIQQIFGGPLGK
jgi:hypothetical protein